MDINKEASESGSQRPQDQLINTFMEITSSTTGEAQFFLESHNFDLDAAVSTFLESTSVPAVSADATAALPPYAISPSTSPSGSSRSASLSPSRSRSHSPPPAYRSPYNHRSRRQHTASSNANSNIDDGNNDAGNIRGDVSSSVRAGGIRTLADLKGSGSGDSDRAPEYYTGGEKSGMLVQDPSKDDDIDTIFNRARQLGAVERPADLFQPSSSSRSFTGTGRLLSGESVPSVQRQQPEVTTYTITFWHNGFTINGGPLRRFDDPGNAPFLESIRNSECPKELEPAERSTQVHVALVRKDENCPEPEKQQVPFQGVGRTLGCGSGTTTPPPPAEPSATAAAAASLSTTAPSPTPGLVVDDTLPSTSLQLRLADGTRMVSRFNYHHTIRDIRAFIDSSRPGKTGDYKLQTMGFPPKQLTDLDQTIEHAGLANSVVIQKL
ncbi:hypothetical protein Nepgr_000543 [Nepenthes gracilis]|uniref:Uncharacterized protein n=1 Tax=Nepenthes gracilis TaxID=150966 RepID=A0AAD3P6K9_NEPGR|nr:hypothetical protein Nepgr_000543 [Nepenthes gracilis]